MAGEVEAKTVRRRQKRKEVDKKKTSKGTKDRLVDDTKKGSTLQTPDDSSSQGPMLSARRRKRTHKTVIGINDETKQEEVVVTAREAVPQRMQTNGRFLRSSDPRPVNVTASPLKRWSSVESFDAALPSKKTPQQLVEESHAQDLFVTMLYGYLVNRYLDDCNSEDIKNIFQMYFKNDLKIKNHLVRAKCILSNWDTILFRYPPNMKEDRDEDDEFFLSTVLYISMSKKCQQERCACKSTQGHLRWTKSHKGHILEVFTMDWQHNELNASFVPLGFGTQQDSPIGGTTMI